MEFYTSFCEKRPIRLCEATRKFAYESLYEHRYGLETRASYAFSIDGAEDFEDLTDITPSKEILEDMKSTLERFGVKLL